MNEPSTLDLPDGRVLAFDDVGDPRGRPVVYLHGTPDSRLARHPDDSLAAALGVRLVAVDRPGAGYSSPHDGGTVGSFAADIAVLADHLGLDHYAVLAWSAGAMDGLACGANEPGRVTAVGVAAGLVPHAAYTDRRVLDATNDDRRLFVEMVEETGAAETALALAPFLVPDPPTLAAAREHLLSGADAVRRDELDSVPGALDVMAASLVDSVRGGLEGITRDLEVQATSPDVELGAITCPVHLWYGAQDPVAPPAFGRWYAGHLPTATLEVIDGASHNFPLTHWRDLLSHVASGVPQRR